MDDGRGAHFQPRSWPLPPTLLFALLLVLMGISCGELQTQTTRFERVEFWNFTTALRWDGAVSMIALRESGLIQPTHGHHGVQNRDIVSSTEVWLVRWSDVTLRKPNSLEHICILEGTENQRFYTIMEDERGVSVLVEEHGFVDGKVTLTSWLRSATGFEITANLTVDELVTVSRKGCKFLARNGSSAFVGDGRTLKTLRSNSIALDQMLESASTLNMTWITRDGRYVVCARPWDSQSPVTISVLDLETKESSEFTLKPRENWIHLAYAESVQDELQLVIAYGRRADNYRELWSYEIVDSHGETMRALKLAGSLNGTGNMNHSVLWDVEGKRFFSPVDHRDFPDTTVDVLGEDGKSSRVIPKLPAEFSGPRHP